MIVQFDKGDPLYEWTVLFFVRLFFIRRTFVVTEQLLDARKRLTSSDF